MRKPLLVFLLLACATASLPAPADKDKDSPAPAKAAKEDAKDGESPPRTMRSSCRPFPPTRRVAQSIVLDGRR